MVVGKNILDNLTTGMYSDSKVIFREYIQNACDQIDLAVELGILSSQKDGIVDIYTDAKKRYISIKDNATGVKSSLFIEDVGDIANSNKQIGKTKGFRGIGRLCGLAYCKTLRFSSSYLGEKIKSIMTCDAQKMRAMLVEQKKYSLDDIWESIVNYSTEPAEEDEHFFEVELLDINKENTDLLDQKKVKDYLSFVAPVPYKNTFILRKQIYDYAQSNGFEIDEYIVKVNGYQIFKEYTTFLKRESGSTVVNYDEISKLEFKNFIDSNGEIIAWMWYGLSKFEKAIPAMNQMKGLRLRSGNIQIGNEDVLKSLFKEPRGNSYFVGEVFAVSRDLIPNSQRDYFNENSMRVEFEDLLRSYFYDVLHKLYYGANKIKNAYKKQQTYIDKVNEFNKKNESRGFVDEKDKASLELEINKAKKEAEEATKQLEKLSNIDQDSPLAEVHKSISKDFDSDKLGEEYSKTDIDESGTKKSDKNIYVTSDMSKLSRSERKIVSKILSIINEIAPKDIAEDIISRIKEEMRK